MERRKQERKLTEKMEGKKAENDKQRTMERRK